MTRTARRTPSRPRCGAGPATRLALAALAVLGAGLLTIASNVAAQAPGAIRPVPSAVPSEQGTRWGELQPAERRVLKPLEREWPTIDDRNKRKWQELAGRFPQLTAPEQARVQERMTAWAKLSPRERTEARMHFQEAKQLPAQDRRQRWDAYQALSPEQKQQFVERAAPVANDNGRRPALPHGQRPDRPGRDAAPQAKSNIVPNPAYAAPPKAVSPTLMQARPGATTTLINKRPAPPGHQQAGLPKIAATPEFVNKATLLPQRGPQGAATRSVPPGPEPKPRK